MLDEPADPIALMFGGMRGREMTPTHSLCFVSCLGSGSARLSTRGCGSGRQTLVLASELGVPVHALDTYQPFLDDLERRARDEGLGELVRTHCLDIAELPRVFRDVDLLWSEGAAYNIGFGIALAAWVPALAPDGHLVVSELCWLKDDVGDDARVFFETGYPEMRSVDGNMAIAERAGYAVLATRPLPLLAWTADYYDVLAPRAKALLGHADPAVREFAAETLLEIDIFEHSVGDFGYVFYMLCRA